MENTNTVHIGGQNVTDTGHLEMPDFLKRTLADNENNSRTMKNILEDTFEYSEVEEPVLVEIDEYGNEISQLNKQPAWRSPTGEFCLEAFTACHIKHWQYKQQRSRWNKINSETYSKYGLELKIRKGWILSMIKWAEEKNRGRYAIAINIDNLMKAINNDTGYEKFKQYYFTKGTTE